MITCYIILPIALFFPLKRDDVAIGDYQDVPFEKYNLSPFKYMYNSKNEQALLNTTGLDHRTFQELLNLYEPFFKKYMWDKKRKKVRLMKVDKFGRPYRRKPRDMDAAGSLGLILTWFRTRGACTRNLSFTFGLTSSQIYNWILFGRRVLLSILQKHPLAKISLPTTKEIDQYTNVVHVKYPQIPPTWGAGDGVKLTIIG